MPEERFDDIHDIFERLSGDARTNPVSEHVMDVQSTEALEEARTLVDHAINQVIRERKAKDTEVDGFISIRMSEAIFAIVQYAIKRRKIAAFLVPAGCGKTLALQALEIDTPGAILITVRGSRSTVKSFLQLWARKLGLNETGRAEDIQDRIIHCLEGSSRLVLIDEAHKLSVAAIDAMREVWDEAKIPIILAGTPGLYQTLKCQRIGTYGAELMEQLYSRVSMFRDLTELENPKTGQPEKRFTIGDIRKIYARGHVRLAPDGLDWLCKLANTPGEGGLRGCSELVQKVVDLYPGELVTDALLRRAMVMHMGARVAAVRMDTAEIVRKPAAASA